MRTIILTIAFVAFGFTSVLAELTKTRALVMPSGAYIASFHEDFRIQYYLYQDDSFLFDSYNTVDWTDGAGGMRECSCNPPQHPIPETTWPESFPAGFGITTVQASVDAERQPYEVTYYQNYQRSAKAKVNLATGGRAGSTAQNLFVISASATAYPYPWWPFASGRGIAPDQIRVMGKPLGNDGKLYVVLPDDEVFDATPEISGEDNYTFTITAEKHELILAANGTIISETGLVQPQYLFCVGQKVNLSSYFVPSASEIQMASYDWLASSKCVNHASAPNSAGCVTYSNDPDLWRVEQPFAWWTTGGDKKVSLKMGLTFANGQTTSIKQKGHFGMFRPMAAMEYIQPDRHFTNSVDTGLTCKLSLGDKSTGLGYMNYRVQVYSTPHGSSPQFFGNANMTQLVTAHYSNPYYNFSDERCDGPEFYNQSHTRVIYDGSVFLNDVPSSIWTTPNIIDISCRDFVRFQPDSSESIWVTLGIVTWNAIGIVEQDFWGNWSLTSDVSPDPSGPDISDEFPVWTTAMGGMH